MSYQAMSTNDLVEEHLNFANSIVYHLAKIYNLSHNTIEDAKSAAYVGLIEAATKYKKGKESVPFKSYAYFRIKGAVIDYFRKDTACSNRYMRLARAYSAIADVEEKVLNIQESDSQDEDIAKVFELVSKGALVFKLSKYDATIDQVADEKTLTPENEILSKEENEKIKRCIEKLPEKEREIIVEYYFHGKTFAEISSKHQNYSRSWITRLHTRALNMLKEILENENE